jgi:hypothetical protein
MYNNTKMNTEKMTTENPNQLIYENQLLSLTVLGGINLEGLDRMRVTLKISLRNSSVPPLGNVPRGAFAKSKTVNI